MRKSKLFAFSTFFSVMLILGISSCKDKSPTKGTVVVTFENGNPVIGATVVVSCPEGDCTVVKATKEDNKKVAFVEGVSGGEGKVSFEFDLPAVLKVDVSYQDTATVYTGEGFLKLEEHEEVEQTIIIYP